MVSINKNTKIKGFGASGVVSEGVQTPLGTRLDFGTQSRYEAPGDLPGRVSMKRSD